MKDLEYPRLMYRLGTAWELETGRYDLRTAHSAEEAETAHAEGWRLDQYAARDVDAEPAAAPAEAPAAAPAAPRRRKVTP
jgi:hypothetical protein